MAIGNNLKTLRTKKGMTQKELAEALSVSYQAVSRWENDEVEPDISTLSKLSSIFEVSVDEIINGNFDKKEETADKAAEVAAVATAVAAVAASKEEKPSDPTTKPSSAEVVGISSSDSHEGEVLGTCFGCGKVIHYGEPHNKITKPATTHRHRGHTVHSPGYTRLYCPECDRLREKGKLSSEGKKLPKFGKKRLVFGLIFGIATLIGCMIGFLVGTNMSTVVAIFLPIALGYGVFAEIYCLFTDCFIGEMFVDIATFSIKMPGIIFTFDLDGLAFLIVMKILFAIIGFFIGIAVFLFAVAFTMFLSLFTFPFVANHEAI